MSGRLRNESSLRGRLLLMTAALLVPALIVASLLLWQAYVQERQWAQRQLRETARALSLVVDRQIGQSRVLLETLASSRSLREGDYAAFDERARKAVTDGALWVAVTDEHGQQRVNTRVPPGTSLPRLPPDSPEQSWTSLDDGHLRLRNLARQPVSGEPVIALELSVPQGQGHSVSLGAVTPASSFARIFEEQRLPSDWTGAVVDARGIVVARSRDAARFVGSPAPPDVLAAVRQRSEGLLQARTLDGTPTVVAYNRSQRTGWTFLVAIPREQFAAAARRSLALAALAGLLLLGGGLLLALRVGRGIAEPLEALALAARAMGRGERIAAPAVALAEAGAVQRALVEAGDALRRREAELQALNQTLEQRVAEATEGLVQAQKMEAIGRLTGGIAHDFNNLLTAVIGNLELVEARNTDSRAARLLGAARQAAERGARLTAQLLAFSRKQRLRPTAIDINAAAENACELLRSTLGGTITIRLQLEAGLGPAIADATQLDLVILNLAVNARDAMPGGGTIVIATRSVRIDEPPSRPEQPDPGEYVCLSLSDTGSGMTAQVRERAFEPFFTTKDIGQGTGLGLPQVLGVAKQLGGGVDIDSQPGVGTTVRLYLPRAEPRAAAAAPALPEVSTGSLAGLRVLLVDDDEDVRATTAAILADFGCEVLQAAGGEAALALAAAATTDLALIDYAMPGLDGLQTAARLRCQDPQLPVLLMSGYADIGSMQALGDAGVGSVLAKPFPAAVLRERLLALRSAAVPHPCA